MTSAAGYPAGPSVSAGRLDGLLHQIATAARIAALPIGEGWCSSILLPRDLFEGNPVQSLCVVAGTRRATMPNELLRVDFNLPDGMSTAPELLRLLRAELEPFIIGVGRVIVQESSEGFVILRANASHEGDDLPAMVYMTEESRRAERNYILAKGATRCSVARRDRPVQAGALCA